MAVKNELNRRVRETDELQGDGVDADGVELAGVRDIENLLFGESGAGQIRSGFGAGKKIRL